MIYFSSFLVIFASFSVYWNLLRLRPCDRLTAPVVQLMRQNQTTQKRDGSQKDLWIPKQKERVHVRLVSDRSELFLENRAGKIEAVEQMRNLICTEGASKILASEGIYSYRSRKINLKNLRAQIKTPAREAFLSAAEAELQPSHWRATGSVSITTSDLYTAQGECLDYFVKKKLLLLTSPDYCAFSHAKKSFALADRCSYSLNQNSALLECSPLRRVLFWQKEGAQSLSASQVTIRLHPQEVEAFGDTHCTFNDEEQNLLKTFFSKYL